MVAAEGMLERAAKVGRPTVVVDDLHITYRVVGPRPAGAKGDGASALSRVLSRKQAPGMREIKAIRGVTFTANHGDAIGLIGRNGSGKSTLLRAIAGLLPPEAGAVYTDCQPSLLGVNAALIQTLSGTQNVMLGGLAMGMTPTEVREKYASIVDFSGIGDFIDLPMTAYSSGMSARLRFAIAASVSHDVLLIDEALATGDAEFRRKSETRIRELRDEAGTVFLVSHGLGVIRETCNRAIWLDKGLIKMDGDVDTVLDAYEELVER
jgi:teichoic acid transport system ATP-binding protein